MVMTRVHGWEAALVRFASAQVGRAFEYGLTDCASLAFRGLGVIYKVPPVPAMLYHTSWQARGAFKALEGGVPPWLALHGAVELTRYYVQAGDVLVLPSDTDGFPSLGIAASVSKVLLSSKERGPYMLRTENLPDGATVWRFA